MDRRPGTWSPAGPAGPSIWAATASAWARPRASPRFPARTHASSTKGFTGQTLGAAGIVEGVISLLAIERGLMPGTVTSATLDPGFCPQIRLAPANGEVRYALSKSFGFGGNNCELVFDKAAQT